MPSIDSNEKIRLMRDGTIHSLGLVLSSIAGMLLVPIMVHGLGAEGYGLWIASVAAASLFGSLDLGLRLIIVRDLSGELRQERAPVLRMMFWMHLALGVIAAVMVAMGGVFGASRLHLSPDMRAVAPVVFLLAGCACLFDQLFAYVLSVWAGLRRFDLFNTFSVVGSIVRIVVFAAALALGQGIVTIALLQLAMSAATALFGLILIWISVPLLRLRWGRPAWSAMREPLRFGVVSQAATSIASLQVPISTLLISVISGTAAVTPFTVGQKFPNLVSGLNWRCSEVFFPVASRSGAREPEQFLAAISRWLMLFIAPCALGVFVLAPLLLRTWMGEVDPIALTVMRVAAFSVIVETWIPGAVQLFWGAGQTRIVLLVNLATVIADVLLAVLLLPRIGPAGAAWATLGSTVVAAFLYWKFASERHKVRVTVVLQNTFHRLLPALLLALLPAYFLQGFVHGRSWAAVLSIVTVSAAFYVSGLWIYAASDEEKIFLAGLFRKVRVGSVS